MRSFIKLLAALCCSITLFAQEVDPIFNPRIFSKANITQAAIDSEGNIYFTGKYDLVRGEPRSGMSKLNPNGSLNDVFSIGSGFDGDIFRMVSLSTDKLLIIGNFTEYKGVETGPMVQINVDGSIDDGFVKATGIESQIQNPITNVIELPNGKLLVYGRFSNYNGFATNSIVILNQDGTVDDGFSHQDENVLFVSQTAPQSSGKMVLSVSRANSQPGLIMRLNADGTKDETFNDFDTGTNTVHKIMAQSTDKLLVLSDAPEGDQPNVDLIRLNANGTSDDSFDLGAGILGFFDDFQLNQEDEIFIGSSRWQTEEGGSIDGNSIGLVSRLEPDGAFGSSFASRLSGDSSRVALGKNNEVAIYGRFLSVEDHATRGIALFNNDEVRDADFVADIRKVGETSIVASYGGGNTYLGTRYSEEFDSLGRVGLFLNYRGLVETSLDIEIEIAEIRVLKPFSGVGVAVAGGPAGSAPIFRMLGTDDRGFVFNSEDYRFNDNWVNDVEKSFLSGAPVFAAGSFSGYNGQTDGVAGVVRFGIGGVAGEGMGDVDHTFVSPFRADSVNITDVEYHSDVGKLIVVGVFAPAASNETELINGIARLNIDGSFDETFDWSNHFSGGIIQHVEVIEDGYIIAGGFTAPRKGIAKINNDGSLNTEFNADDSFVFNEIADAQVFGDGIYVGGDLIEYQGHEVYGLMKLDLDGNLDQSFKLPNTLSAKVNDMDIDHTITLAGLFYDSIQNRKLSAVRLEIAPDAAPTDLTFSYVTDNNVNFVDLSWTDMSTNEEGFIVEVSHNNQNDFHRIRWTGANTTAEHDNPSESGSTYYYRVAAFKGNLISEYSNTVEVAIPQKPLAAPSSLAGTIVSDNQIDLSWTDNSENEESFVIARTVNQGESETIGTVPVNQTSFSDTDIDVSQTLEYLVWARNSIQDSPASNIFRIVITSIVEGLPSQDNRFNFTYDPISEELSFKLNSPSDKIRGYQVVSSSGVIKMREESLETQQLNLSLSGNAVGIYILHVTSERDKYVMKFIKN